MLTNFINRNKKSSDTSESKSNTVSEFLKNKIERVKRILGIVDKKAPISFEISEFMQETQLSLEKLPKKYKKLYELTPTDAGFFVNRVKELEVLENTYDNWTKNRFVSCALVGEKGCGVTSMLNSFLASISKTDTLRENLHEKIHSKEEYFAYFNSFFKTKEIVLNQGFIDHLNNAENSKIIILENLHHMYLKKVGGFEAIKLLFELISYTTKKVLWIGVFTPDAWNYLDKTISISNYFTSIIDMEPFSPKDIKETILKRNEHANLEIEFIQKEENTENPATEKQEDKENQESLEEQFFKQLYKLSNGNISLALLYWVRAIEKIEENHIFIKQIENLDYTFIKNLSSEALFALQTLILHDGLTLRDFSIVTGESNQECRKRLMPMLEKGLLIQPNKKYNINPAIYKHIHDYLSSKNYIH